MRSIVRLLLAGCSLTLWASASAAQLPQFFTVMWEDEIESDVILFACKFEDAGRLRCDLSELQVKYFSDANQRKKEPTRCRVMSTRFKGYLYEPRGVGKWTTQDDVFGEAIVEYEISTNEERTTVTETVMRTSGSETVKFVGPLGAKKVYRQVDAEPHVKKVCSSIDMQPL